MQRDFSAKNNRNVVHRPPNSPGNEPRFSIRTRLVCRCGALWLQAHVISDQAAEHALLATFFAWGIGDYTGSCPEQWHLILNVGGGALCLSFFSFVEGFFVFFYLWFAVEVFSFCCFYILWSYFFRTASGLLAFRGLCLSIIICIRFALFKPLNNTENQSN